jgi:ribosomal protein L34E
MNAAKKILIEANKCPRCGSDFHCGKSGKCWCYEVDLPPSLLEKIDDTYDSCLCPDCLKEVAKSGTITLIP